jgi:hypothetical protein
MPTNEAFRRFYESELSILLQPLENYRLKRIKLFKKLLLLSFALIALLVLNFKLGNKFAIAFNVVLIIASLGYSYDSLAKTNLHLRKDYKKIILPRILFFINHDFEYIPQQKIAKSVFEKSLLFSSEINAVDGEDFMQFQIGNSHVMFCEAKVYGFGRESLLFDGVFISAAFNKSFQSKTFIFPQKTTSFFRKIKFRILGSHYIVKLEDPEFEREFIVLGEDQVETRYILTTSLMKRILEYKRKLRAELAFSFISNRIYCTIPNTSNLFEPALFETFLNFDFILKSYEPVILYSGIVEDLNLSLRIWSKQ